MEVELQLFFLFVSLFHLSVLRIPSCIHVSDTFLPAAFPLLVFDIRASTAWAGRAREASFTLTRQKSWNVTISLSLSPTVRVVHLWLFMLLPSCHPPDTPEFFRHPLGVFHMCILLSGGKIDLFFISAETQVTLEECEEESCSDILWEVICCTCFLIWTVEISST